MPTIEIEGRRFMYELRESARARRLRVTVYPGGRVVVTKPPRQSTESAERFLRRVGAWVLKAHERHARIVTVLPGGRRDFVKRKGDAQALVESRVRHFNSLYRFNVGTISVRNNKTRWGSCSRNGNLNFNYKLVYLDSDLVDYVVVHEICHLGEFNHSKAFWALVEKTIPAHRAIRARLRTIAH